MPPVITDLSSTLTSRGLAGKGCLVGRGWYIHDILGEVWSHSILRVPGHFLATLGQHHSTGGLDVGRLRPKL